MSKFYVPTKNSPRQLQNQWINLIIHSHDQFCDCQTPIKHLEDILLQQKCRHFKDAATTTEDGGTPTDPDTIIDAGDLDILFSEENDVTEG